MTGVQTCALPIWIRLHRPYHRESAPPSHAIRSQLHRPTLSGVSSHLPQHQESPPSSCTIGIQLHHPIPSGFNCIVPWRQDLAKCSHAIRNQLLPPVALGFRFILPYHQESAQPTSTPSAVTYASSTQNYSPPSVNCISILHMPCHAHPLTIPDPTRCTHPVLSPDSDLSLLVATSSCPPPTSLSAPGLYYRPSPPHLSPCLLHMILPLSIQVLCLSTPPTPVSQPIVTAISPTISYRLPISPQSVYVTRTTSSFKPTTLTAPEL